MTETDPEKIPFPDLWECKNCHKRFEPIDGGQCPHCGSTDHKRVRKIIITTPLEAGKGDCPICGKRVRVNAVVHRKYYDTERTDPYIEYQTGIQYSCPEHPGAGKDSVKIIRRPGA